MCNQRHRWPAEGLWLKCAETCEAAGLDFGLCQSGPQGDQMGNLGEVRWRGHLPGCAQGVLPTIKDRVITGGLPRWLSKGGKESACQCRRLRFDPWVGKILWGRAWQPTPVFLPGESHGHRSLAGYSPWGHKRVHTTWWLNDNIITGSVLRRSEWGMMLPLWADGVWRTRFLGQSAGVWGWAPCPLVVVTPQKQCYLGLTLLFNWLWFPVDAAVGWTPHSRGQGRYRGAHPCGPYSQDCLLCHFCPGI